MNIEDKKGKHQNTLVTMRHERESGTEWIVNFATSETNKNGKKMSKVTLSFPVDALQGKVNSQDSAYFAKRNGKCFLNRIVNPFTGDPTEKQIAVQTKFATINTQVSNILNAGAGNEQYDSYKAAYERNHGKAETLRAYIFDKLWKT